MKIAIITPNLAHYRKNLYNIFDAEETMEFIHYADEREHEGIATLPPSQLKNFRSAHTIKLGFLIWQRGVLRAAFDKKIDRYVFTGDYRFLSTWIASIIIRFRKKPLFFWTMGWRKPETGPKKLVRNIFYALANKLMLYSPAGKNLGTRQGFPSSKMEVVFNSVTNLGKSEINKDFSAKKISSVGAVSRLTPAKKLPLLLDAVSILNRRGTPVKVILAGSGPDQEKLELKAQELNLECEFTGAIYSSEEIREFYNKIDITVVPASIGLATIQSLAHGVPVITDDALFNHGPEVAAIIDGITGGHYAAENALDLADQIEKWIAQLTQSTDETAQRCREEVQNHWTPQAQADRMIKVIGSD